jgi:tripartite ATP-independent transporter DctM subunit
LQGVVSPLILLLAILGGIYSGAISPMEASAVGAAGALICAAIYRRLTWKVLKDAFTMTFRISSMIAWALIALGLFTSVYSGIGAQQLARNIAHSNVFGPWGMIILMQVALIVFGMFMDDFAVIMIFGPIFSQIVRVLGFDTLWFGIVFMVNIQLAFLTPPYGFSIFCMKAAAPKEFDLTMGEIYQAALPFIGLQFIGLMITMVFSPVATYLPSLIIR